MNNNSNQILTLIEVIILLLWFLIYFHVKIPFYFSLNPSSNHDDYLVRTLLGMYHFIKTFGFVGITLFDLVLNIVNIAIIRWCFLVQKFGFFSLFSALMITIFITMPVERLEISGTSIYLYVIFLCMPNFWINFFIAVLYVINKSNYELVINQSLFSTFTANR